MRPWGVHPTGWPGRQMASSSRQLRLHLAEREAQFVEDSPASRPCPSSLAQVGLRLIVQRLRHLGLFGPLEPSPVATVNLGRHSMQRRSALSAVGRWKSAGLAFQRRCLLLAAPPAQAAPAASRWRAHGPLADDSSWASTGSNQLSGSSGRVMRRRPLSNWFMSGAPRESSEASISPAAA